MSNSPYANDLIKNTCIRVSVLDHVYMRICIVPICKSIYV